MLIMYTQEIEIDDELVTKEVKDFIDVTGECASLYAKKNHDYGNSFDKGMNAMGMSYGVGRLFDKMNRLVTLMTTPAEVKDESIEDTLKDMACYSIMMLAYNKRQRENKMKDIDLN